MSHAVESMMYAGETPWHKLGTKVNENILTADAIKAAGLDWNVKAVPLYTGQEYGSKEVPNRAVLRETDNRILGIIGPNYVPLQNSEAFSFFDSYLEAGEAKLNTAGSLVKGQKIWVLASLNRAPIEVVKGDIVEKYLLLSNSHRGGIAVHVGFTPVRVVCANTLAMAKTHSQSKLLRVVHGKQMKDSLEKIKEVINAANADFEATAEQYKFLARKQINKTDLEKFVKIVFKTNDSTSRSKMREDKLTETITRLFETGKGNAQKNVAGSYWALYNAATEYLTHESNKDAEKRLNNVWFGYSKQTNADALKTAVVMAGG
jgi:phage/plasmid-like protein (TIGR03299 family)